MNRMLALTIFALSPAALGAQQDPVARLGEVLPPSVAQQVLDRIEAAGAQDLPTQAMANLALEGVAKGRSAEEVLAAVETLVGDMGRARSALETAGHEPRDGEIEAATTALRMGVDGNAISALARSGPSGRMLTVPLLVMAGLSQRGLPSDQALAQVLDRMSARSDDAGLLEDFPEVGHGAAVGRPDDVGPGFNAPETGTQTPVGPQGDHPTGRGRGHKPGGD